MSDPIDTGTQWGQYQIDFQMGRIHFHEVETMLPIGRSPFARVQYSVDGERQEMALRLDMDKQVFLDKTGDDDFDNRLSEVGAAAVCHYAAIAFDADGIYAVADRLEREGNDRGWWPPTIPSWRNAGPIERDEWISFVYDLVQTYKRAIGEA